MSLRRLPVLPSGPDDDHDDHGDHGDHGNDRDRGDEDHEGDPAGPGAKPPWLAARAPSGPAVARVQDVVARLGLATVCESARCPNQGTCWGEGTATFMVMGALCTRGCRFCHVGKSRTPPPLAPDEPARLAAAVAALGLETVVVTSVDRDDLPDRGAAHLAACVRALRSRPAEMRAVSVELLLPDLDGDPRLLDVVAGAGADVLAHNLETVERLTPLVRDRRATYERSILALAHLKRRAPTAVTKSGLMLGLGETPAEIDDALRDLREAGVDIVTLGQYLRPSPAQLPVRRWVPPDELAAWARRAVALGFRAVAAAPLVRSSWRAGALLAAARGAAPPIVPAASAAGPVGPVGPADPPPRAPPQPG